MEDLKQFKISDYFDKTFHLIMNRNFFKLFGIFSFLFILYVGIFHFIFYKLFNINSEISNHIILNYFFYLINILYFIPFTVFFVLFTDLFYKQLFKQQWSILTAIKNTSNTFLKVIFLCCVFFIIVKLPQLLINISNIPFIVSVLNLLNKFRFIYSILIRTISCLVIPVIVIERKVYPGQIIERIKELFHKNFMNVFLKILCITLIEFIIYLIFVLVLRFINAGLSNLINNNEHALPLTVIITYFSFFKYLFLSIPGIAISFLIYIDLRIKQEGFGVEMMVDDYVKHS